MLSFSELDAELERIEENQVKKVIDLARRICPGLTLEDIRNPHDFPDLDDPDWQYEDGVLAGIQSVRVALRALDRGRSPESADRGRSPESADRGRSPESADRGRSPESADRGRSPESADRGRSPESADRGRSPESADRGRSPESGDSSRTEG